MSDYKRDPDSAVGARHPGDSRPDARLPDPSEALRDQVELWTKVKPGSLYSALNLMSQDGLVAVERVERPGTSPERTIYRITAAGRRELLAQRDAALTRVGLAPDPLDLALRYVSDLT